MEAWGYLEWGIVITAVVEFTILFCLAINHIQKRRSKAEMDKMNDFNDDEFNEKPFDFEQRDLPGLGKPPVSQFSVDENIQPAFDEQLVILITQLECASRIIPDVEFGEADSIEVIQLKQNVLKIKKMLDSVLC